MWRKKNWQNRGGMSEALNGLLSNVPDGGVIASLGGGYGAWLTDVLNQHPSLKGLVFDTPPVLDDAMRLFDVLELSDRLAFLPGDLASDVPPDADIYVLKSVLQRYGDNGAGAVLDNCRKAMTSDARLLILERLMPDNALDDPEAIMLDLHMLAITGGKLRRLAEMETLIAEAGLGIVGHRRTGDGMTAIDVRTVDA